MVQQQTFNHDMKVLIDVIYDWMKPILYESEPSPIKRGFGSLRMVYQKTIGHTGI